MKPMTLAAFVVAAIVGVALFVYFMPSASVATPPNTIIVGVADQTSTHGTPKAPSADADKRQAQNAFSFGGVMYFHRSSQSNERIDIHEFTPEGQSDLSAWKDMVSLIHYRDVTDAEGLKEIAGLMHSMYESSGGKVLIANASTPTEGKPMEYFLVGVLRDKGIVETVFNRLMLHEGKGKNMMTARRAYGDTAGNEMSEWFRDHGKTTSEGLVAMDANVLNGAIPQR